MLRITPKAMLELTIWLTCAVSLTIPLQTAAQSSLESQLESVYKVTKFEGNTQTVIAPGVLLRLAKSNLLYETPLGNMFRCNATVKADGSTQIPSGTCLSMTKGEGVFLQSGQLLYISKIKVNPGKDIVTFELTEAAAGQNGNAAWPTFKTGVNFVFQSGFLAKADPGQVADVINTVLPMEGGNDNSQAAAQPAPTQQAAPQQAPMEAATAPAQSGAQIQLGMTEDQVKSILGQPTTSRNYSGTTVYMYQKMITFQNGKVSGIR